jgi:uncharacterized protein YjbI with pentapeptide repeats/uncharacterized caspase-like protein
MIRRSQQGTTSAQRYALCVGIGKYTKIENHDLRYAVGDAEDVYQILADPARGDCTATLLTTPEETTKEALTNELSRILELPDPEDLVIIYLSGHGEISHDGQVFLLLPSDTKEKVNEKGKATGRLDSTSLLDINDLTKQFTNAQAKNIIMLLDVCYSGGAGDIFLRLPHVSDSDDNIHIIGAALRNHTAQQSSVLGHGIFTAALLEAFQQKPEDKTQWVMIHQIIFFLQNRIKDYQYDEYGPVRPIRAHSRQANPLRVVKNPRYSKENVEFAEKVAQLLEMRSYHKEDISPPQYAPPNFYVATVEAGMDTIKDGIIPIYNEVEALTVDEVDRIASFVQKQVMQGNLHRGTIVLAHDDLNNAIRNYNSPWLKIHTMKSIESSLIDFQPYLRNTILAKYEQSETEETPPLAKVYIPLQATNVATGEEIEIEKAVRQWLTDDEGSETAPRLAILADYGSGKSTFCTHLAAMLAREHLRERECYGYSTIRIPLLISLKNFADARHDLKDYIISYLKEDCHVESARGDRLMRMAERGQLLFLLDGFDEMASKATAETLEGNIAYIEQLARGRNKILVTTRQEFLFDLAEEQHIFRHYQRFSLNPFNPDQVEDYLEKRVDFINAREGKLLLDWEQSLQKIQMIPNLSDLIQRPVLLKMIFQSLPDLLSKKTAIYSTDLYHLYIHKELSRRPSHASRQGEIGKELRLAIMEQMALWIYRSNSVGLPIGKIRTIIHSLFTHKLRNEMEAWLREVAPRSLLTRKKDIYEFSHESFMEYLVACQLAKAIKDNNPELFELKIISRTIKGFLIELEEGYAQDSDQHVRYQKATLMRWFRQRPKRKIFSANMFTLLVNLFSREELQDLPLRDAELDEAILSHAQLQNILLEGVHLEKGHLDEANLQEANLINATLRSANLNGANLQGARLNAAHMEKTHLVAANLECADLAGASLAEAHLQRTNLVNASLLFSSLEKADLRVANLQGADLQGADLRGANLQGADLQGADLRGANLQGADLQGAILP